MGRTRARRIFAAAAPIAWAVVLGGCYQGVDGYEPGGGPELADDGGDGADDGADDGGSSADRVPGGCADKVGNSPLRRLTRTQYTHTIRDLLGIDTDVAQGFSSDEKIGAFYSNGIAPITDLGVEKYMEAAESLAHEAVTDVDALLPCDPLDIGQNACVDAFIADLGRRAFRRPLRAEEREQMRDLFATAAAEGGFDEGIRLIVQGFLQSPYFLYHVELGRPDVDGDGFAALTQYEVASRLSYFLWNSMPDDTLLAAADADELGSAEGVRAQAERMLADPRAKDGIAAFHLQWLGVDDMSTLEKDAEMFPGFDDALKSAMQAETADFADWVIRQGDGKLETLLTAPFTVIDERMAAVYGVTLPPDHVPGEPVMLDATQRAGLLTHASLLAKYAHVDQSSPVHRGVIVRENFLCQTLPPPPENVDNVPPDPDPNATTRERFAEHTEDPACAGCHVLIDGIGFGLENYDAVGAWRDMEGTLPVDASGEVVGTKDINGEFDGAVELAHKLAQSTEVQECVSTQWMSFALGRVPSEEDECSTDLLMERFAASGYDVRELLLGLVETEAFRMRRIGGGGQ
jgi:hypothetical protein